MSIARCADSFLVVRLPWSCPQRQAVDNLVAIFTQDVQSTESYFSSPANIATSSLYSLYSISFPLVVYYTVPHPHFIISSPIHGNMYLCRTRGHPVTPVCSSSGLNPFVLSSSAIRVPFFSSCRRRCHNTRLRCMYHPQKRLW